MTSTKNLYAVVVDHEEGCSDFLGLFDNRADVDAFLAIVGNDPQESFKKPIVVTLPANAPDVLNVGLHKYRVLWIDNHPNSPIVTYEPDFWGTHVDLHSETIGIKSVEIDVLARNTDHALAIAQSKLSE